jgi:hypothetical protein
MNDAGSVAVDGGIRGATTDEGCHDNDRVTSLDAAKGTGKPTYRRFVQPAWLTASTNLAVIAGLIVAGLLLAN